MVTRIAFYSDLHTEFRFKSQSKLPINNDKDLYIFAGDLFCFADAEKFFQNIRKQTVKPVIIVLGNHDFYGKQYQSALSEYRELGGKYNIQVLEQDLYINNDRKLMVFGATFWSDFKINSKKDEIAMLMSKSQIPDFRHIYNETLRPFTPDDECKIAEVAKEKLTNSFNGDYLSEQGYADYTKIVVSHFPPLSTVGNPCYKDNVLDVYFGPDYSDLLPLADIWIYGHNHYNLRQWHIAENGKKTLLISNQHGYINEKGILTKRECGENKMPVEINFHKITEEELLQLGQDFYCDMSILLGN